jgi:hypothetical protein
MHKAGIQADGVLRSRHELGIIDLQVRSHPASVERSYYLLQCTSSTLIALMALMLFL